MSHVTSPALQTVHADHSRIGLIALWAVQLALAGMFLLAGGSKLAGAPAMIALFDGIGIGQWFRYVTGLIEVGSAVALLVPSDSRTGARSHRPADEPVRPRARVEAVRVSRPVRG